MKAELRSKRVRVESKRSCSLVSGFWLLVQGEYESKLQYCMSYKNHQCHSYCSIRCHQSAIASVQTLDVATNYNKYRRSTRYESILATCRLVESSPLPPAKSLPRVDSPRQITVTWNV